jgi:hypothetical protein
LRAGVGHAETLKDLQDSARLEHLKKRKTIPALLELKVRKAG